jgi:hypothetical protein
MKTIYLKSTKKTLLIADIAKVIKDYNGEIEFSSNEIIGHLIGQIPSNPNRLKDEAVTYKSGYHANLLVSDDFDESIFETRVIPPPENPVHKFA